LAQQHTVFLVVMVSAFILDAIDGPIARYLHQASAQGARLDTVADSLLYAALVIGVWQLWPSRFYDQQLFILVAALGMVLPLLVALLKFHTYTSYHTWLVKFATVWMACGAFLLIAGGPAWPFQVASIISLLGGLEQTAITLLLERPRSDVPHVVAILRERKQGKAVRNPPVEPR
jgi:CDP-diacylglycerol--glycerol-3-phosphate 3-phosphatidyltransferase